MWDSLVTLTYIEETFTQGLSSISWKEMGRMRLYTTEYGVSKIKNKISEEVHHRNPWSKWL